MINEITISLSTEQLKEQDIGDKDFVANFLKNTSNNAPLKIYWSNQDRRIIWASESRF